MATTADAPSMRERIGGRWAISWPFAVSMVVISTLAFPYATPVTGPSGVSTAAVMGIVAIANVIAILLVPLAGMTVFRRRRSHPVPIWAVFALGTSITIARELLLRPALGAFDLRVAAASSLRMAALMLLGGLFAVGFALLLDEAERLRTAVDDINVERIRLREQERLGDELIESIELAAEAEIALATSAILDEVADRIDTVGVDQRVGTTEALRTFVDARLRPLSLELYELEEAPVPLMRVRDVLRAGLRSRPIRPGVTALILGVVILIYQIQRFPVDEALLQASGHAVLVFAALAGAAFAARRGLVGDVALLLAVLLAIVFTSGKILILNAGDQVLSSGILIANGAWIVAAVLAASLLDALFSGRSTTLPTIRATLDDQTIDAIVERRELVRVSRELAAYVHGTLQSTLLAVAFAIEDATRTGDERRLLRALQEARSALRDASVLEPRGVVDLERELRRCADQWRGYLEVSVAVTCPRSLPATTIRSASAISQEALVNARKHGRATHVRITASMSAPDHLDLVIRDDGIGPGAGARGVGSRQLDREAPNAWSLTANPDGVGSTLAATLRAADVAPSMR